MKLSAWNRWLLVWCFGNAVLWSARAQSSISFPPQTNCIYDLSAVTQAFTNTLATAGIANGSLLILKDGQKLHELYAGTYQPNTLRPLASASKWLSAVVIMSLVDDGVMSLDDPVSLYFPAEYTGQKGTMTIRQMFSHTSGLPGTHEDWVLNSDDITLQQAAQFIATNNLIAAPGAVLCYGGLSMHLPARAPRSRPANRGLTSWNSASNNRSVSPPPPTATRPIRASRVARPARSTNTPPSYRCS